MSSIEELVGDLRQIDTDLDRVESALILYEKSAKDFGEDQDHFVELLNARRIGGQHDFIQMILLHDCVAALCRITDYGGKNRIALQTVMGHANALYAKTKSAELKLISRSMGSLQTSTDLASLRGFRDMYLGHRLRGDPIHAAYSAIPSTAAQVSEIVGALFSLCGVGRWIGQTSKSLKEEHAGKFWYYLEKGMKDDPT